MHYHKHVYINNCSINEIISNKASKHLLVKLKSLYVLYLGLPVAMFKKRALYKPCMENPKGQVWASYGNVCETKILAPGLHRRCI